MLVGGRSVDVPIQFHNVDPGNYRLCVVSMNETPPRLVCQPLSVQDYQSVVEASVEI